MDRNASAPPVPGGVPSDPPRRLQWLVSVRSLPEAILADAFPVDILDLKEPRDGALSPVAPEVWNELNRWTESGRKAGRRKPISVALGEADEARRIADLVPPTVAFAKAGPSGCRDARTLRSLWQSVRRRLAAPIELVAVAYADHQRASCVPPREIIAEAADFGCRRILLDTFVKNRGSVVEQLGWQALNRIGETAAQRGLWWSLAGSITSADVTALLRDQPLQYPPDCVAVRGDVCESGDDRGQDRTGQLSAQRLQHWSDALCGATTTRV